MSFFEAISITEHLARSRSVFCNLVYALFCIGSVSATAQEMSAGKGANLAARTGLSITKVWIERSNVEVGKSNLPLGEQSTELDNALQIYQNIKNGYSGISSLTETSKYGMRGIITGAVIYSGGTLLVPGILLGAGSELTHDLMSSNVESRGAKVAKKMLSDIGSILVEEAGLSQLSDFADQPELLRSTIMQSNRLLVDTKRRAEEAGDDQLVTVVTDMLVRTSQQSIGNINTLFSLIPPGKERY